MEAMRRWMLGPMTTIWTDAASPAVGYHPTSTCTTPCIQLQISGMCGDWLVSPSSETPKTMSETTLGRWVSCFPLRMRTLR